MAPPVAEAVTVSLVDLINDTVPSETLQRAFGPDSLGILLVRDLPPEFGHLRHRVLSYGSYLVNLPGETLERLESADAQYLVGWSLGREVLRDGRADTLKGSFYANCAFYADPSLDRARAPASRPRSGRPAEGPAEADFPEYLTANLWPAEPDLAGFRPALEALCRLMIDTAVLVARACDRFAEGERIDGYEPGYLERVVRTSSTTKARLLHYFPQDRDGRAGGGEGPEEDDDWCGSHLDHGCLTALTSAMFVDETAGPPLAAGTGPPPLLPELAASPDPAAGLYVHSRAGQPTQVRIPRGCLAFQTGEALERITRGRFRAVPHFVRGIGSGGSGRVARNTLAVFTQPDLDEIVDRERGVTFGEFARGIVARNLAM